MPIRNIHAGLDELPKFSKKVKQQLVFLSHEQPSGAVSVTAKTVGLNPAGGAFLWGVPLCGFSPALLE